MRFPSAYYLVLIYLTVMFKPLIPVISDMYSHTFGDAIHLATTHAKYGSAHLEKALAGSGDHKDQKNTDKGENYMVHVVSSTLLYQCHLPEIEPRYFSRRLYCLSNISFSILIPPPKH